MSETFLVQILLPLEENDGTPIPRSLFEKVEHELVSQFGGLTAHTRAPAEGVWTEGNAGRVKDAVVVYEVMVGDLDGNWWSAYRNELETRFAQEEIVIRALSMRRL